MDVAAWERSFNKKPELGFIGQIDVAAWRGKAFFCAHTNSLCCSVYSGHAVIIYRLELSMLYGLEFG